MLTDGWPVTALLDPVTGNPDVQYTSDEHAAILAGLIVRDASGAPRAGVFPRHTNGLVTGRPDMKVNVAPFEAVLVNGGVRMIALTEAIVRDIAPAPIANTRIDIVYVIVTDRALTGVASTSEVKVATGNASALPEDPPVPAGAVRLSRVTVAAGATATNAGVTIEAIHQFTATTGGVLLFRNKTEMDAWAAGTGQPAYDIATRIRYLRVVNAWQADGGPETTATITAVAGTFTLSDDSKLIRRGVTVSLNLLAVRTSAITPGVTILTLPAGYRPEVTHVFPLSLVSGAAPGVGTLTVDPTGVVSVGSYLSNSSSLVLRAELTFDIPRGA